MSPSITDWRSWLGGLQGDPRRRWIPRHGGVLDSGKACRDWGEGPVVSGEASEATHWRDATVSIAWHWWAALVLRCVDGVPLSALSSANQR